MTLDEMLALLPDNSTGAIDAADLRTIVTGLWNQGADLEARVAALETADGGALSVPGRWQVNPTPGAEPQGMQISADSLVFADATWMRFARVDQNNNDMTAVLLAATAIFGQQQSDASNWVRYTVSGTATQVGTYVQVPVTWVNGGGSISGAGWQHATIVFTVPTGVVGA